MSFSDSDAQIREQQQENTEKLENIRKQIEETSDRAKNFENEARTLGIEISQIQRDLVKSASEIQTIEDQINNREENLRDLLSQEQEIEERLKEKNFEMASTLGAMQRLSIQKTSVVAFRPDEAINTLRTTSLLKVILPDLQNRASELEVDLSELNHIRNDITQENIDLRSDLAKLVISNNDMNTLLKKRQNDHARLQKSTEAERAKMRQMAENAKDLQDLIDKIEQEIALREKAAIDAEKRLKESSRPEAPISRERSVASLSVPENSTSFSKSKGNIPLPARGEINQRFNQLMSSGQRTKGITIATRKGATVISPHDGRIVYAGKFRSYGQLLIISHGEGYHTLLAGMENINGIVGQWVLKGEPVGQMTLEESPSNSRQRLYVELRQGGKPINPVPWIMAMDRGP